MSVFWVHFWVQENLLVNLQKYYMYLFSITYGNTNILVTLIIICLLIVKQNKFHIPQQIFLHC